MGTLDNFRALEFLDQIGLMTQVEKAGGTEDIPALFGLYLQPINDAAVDTMVRNTLRRLLLNSEEETLKGLASENSVVRTFCLRIAAEKGMTAAGPALLRLAESCSQDPDQLLDVLNAMSRIKSPEFLPVFRQHLRNADDYVASLCVGMAGAYQDQEALPILREIVEANESDELYDRCLITTWRAIESLAALDSPQALAFLADTIHHRNPTARRCVHEQLAAIGVRAVEPTAKKLASSDIDEQIMAANVLGAIGDKKGADSLIQALDSGGLSHPNVLFAAYEALGKIPCMKSLIALMDAFGREQDTAILMAVAEGLDTQANPGVGVKLKVLARAKAEGPRVLQAVIGAEALQLFDLLYPEPDLAPKLVKAIEATADQARIGLFAEHLQALGTPGAVADAARLLALGAGAEARRKLLAIDDSKAMLSFYRTAGGQLGFEVTTAENGKEALDIVTQGDGFDLIVVDMNMPVMDGVEFTRRFRELEGMRDAPILMATTESEKSQAALAKKAGVTSFLKKPFTLEILQNKITNVLG
jgi:CheY-like chemotaxis protein